MKGFDVLKVKSAVKQHNRFDLSRTHLTTLDFAQIIPVFCEETVPGDKFNVSAEYFSRLAPLVKPTYGKFQFKTVSAFVPYHQLAVDSDAWFAGKTVWEGVVPVLRHFTIGDLDAFVRSKCVTTTGATSDNSVYTYIDSDGDTVYTVFDKQGSYYVKVLNSLGYALPEGVDLRTTSNWYTKVSTYKLSALPLLAFVKLYNDYMSQSQRYNTSVLSEFLNCIKYLRADDDNYFNPSDGNISFNGIYTLLRHIRLNYENDYFTSAWQKPNNALGVGESINAATVPSGMGSALVGQFDYDNALTQSNGASGGGTTITIGQRALDFLKSFDDWVRRNNYSGSRAVQQVFSRFGIKTDDYRSHYAHVINTDSMPIQVGDVTATADTSNAILGEYSGKGILSGNNGLSVDVDDYGLIMILGYFTVTPMNAYGFDRRVLRNQPLDFYNPEFDGIGAEAIPLAEIFEDSTIEPSDDTTLSTEIFGFTERYNSYRYGRDVISGEFRNYRPDSDMNVWHTGRLLGQLRADGDLVAQSSSVNTMGYSDSEYNRIFSITDDGVDHFYLTCRFNVSAVRPMLNLNSVVRLGEGDTVVPRNGNVIS